MSAAKKCRVCGCTDAAACQTSEGPCWWVAEDLCSGCVSSAREAGLTPESLAALAGDWIVSQLRGEQALMLLSLVQLALRHPAIGDSLREFGEAHAHALADRLGTIGPEIAAVCQAGFDPVFDVPPGEEPRIIIP